MSQRVIPGLAISTLVLAAFASGPAGPAAFGQTDKKTTSAQTRMSQTKPPGPILLAPDLAIQKIWFAEYVEPSATAVYVPIRGDLKKGVKVALICEMSNAGLGSVKGLWLLGFYIDDVMVWNNSWGDLAGGAPLRGIGSWTPTALGIHNFRCVADVNKNIAEKDETNNQKEILFKVVQ